MGQKKWNCELTSNPPDRQVRLQSRNDSTITYDTLVRAGISCTSAFVPESSFAAVTGSTGNGPPLAKCSRGMKIQPDVYFSLHDSSPVSPTSISPRHPQTDYIEGRLRRVDHSRRGTGCGDLVYFVCRSRLSSRVHRKGQDCGNDLRWYTTYLFPAC